MVVSLVAASTEWSNGSHQNRQRRVLAPGKSRIKPDKRRPAMVRSKGDGMKAKTSGAFSVVLVWAACSLPAAGQSADALGDPLPKGAVGRLGTIRFHHGDQINVVAYSP